MALPETYGPEANDTIDARVAKLHILIWHLTRSLVQGAGSAAIQVAPTSLTPGTPALVTADGNAILQNLSRKAFVIQNLDDAACYVRLGSAASSSVFDFVLPACTVANDGTSPAVMIYGYTGIVSIAAATGSPRVTRNEYT